MFRSIRTLRLVPAAAVAACLGAGVASAQPAKVDPPRVVFESPGGARILEDFTQVLDLAGPAGASQKRGLLDLLDGFLVGVDRDKPVRLEPLTETSPTRYRLFVPVSDRRKWQQDNLNFASGIPSRELAGQKDTYKLGFVRNAAFDGYMRYYKIEDGTEYAVITEQLDDLPSRVAGIGALLKADQDGAMLLRNSAEGGGEAVAARWGRVADAEKELLATLQPKPEETPEQFALRKAAAALQVSSAGRFYSEARDLLIGGEIPEGGIGAVATVLFRPLPGTESEEAFNRVGEEPSRFAGVPFKEDANFSGQMRFPLTARQQDDLRGLGERMKALLISEVNAADLPEAQSKARIDGFEKLFALTSGVLDSGVIDGVVEAVTVDGNRRIVGAFALPDGADAVPAVQAFIASREGREAELNVAEVEGVALHRISLDETFGDAVRDVIGGDEVWLGTAPNAFWYGAGPGAREELEAQIKAAAAGGEASDEFFRLNSNPAAAADFIARLEMAEYEQYREIIQESLRGCGGRVVMTLRKDEGGLVRGRALFPRCILTLVGRIIADISEREKLAG